MGSSLRLSPIGCTLAGHEFDVLPQLEMGCNCLMLLLKQYEHDDLICA